jgi:hypothetical protein
MTCGENIAFPVIIIRLLHFKKKISSGQSQTQSLVGWLNLGLLLYYFLGYRDSRGRQIDPMYRDGDAGAQVPRLCHQGAQQCPHQGLSGTKIVSARAYRDSSDGNTGAQVSCLCHQGAQ